MTLTLRKDDRDKFVALCKTKGIHGTEKRKGEWHEVKASVDKKQKRDLLAAWIVLTMERK